MSLINSCTWRKHGGIDTSPSIPLHDRSFDLVLLSNWEDQITFEPENDPQSAEQTGTDLMAPVNKGLESGAWTQSIIWSPRAPFRDFTQIEFNNGDDIIPEERPPGSYLFVSYPHHASLFYQPRNSDLESVYALTMHKSKTSLTCPMISSMMSQRMVGGIASGRHSGILSSSTPTRHRNCSYHS